MKGFILGVIVTLIVIAAGIYIYFSNGMAPVSTSAQALPFEKQLAGMALRARREKEAPKNVPIQPTEDNLQVGAHEYVEHCATCHGVPGKGAGPIGEGEFPKPPALFEGKGVTDDPVGESYWVIANGIRLTGMPAFKDHLSDQELWQVSLLVKNANQLPQSVITALQQPEEEHALEHKEPGTPGAAEEHEHDHTATPATKGRAPGH